MTGCTMKHHASELGLTMDALREPVVRALAEERGLTASWVENGNDPERGVNLSQLVLVTDNATFLNSDAVRAAVRPWAEDAAPPVLWTDDYSDLFQILK